MDKCRNIIRKLLFPGIFPVCLIVITAGAMLIYAFAVAGENTPIAYTAYLFSAYGLTVFYILVFPPLIRECKRLLRLIPVVDRCFEDLTFRTTVFIFFSLAVNLFYAGLNGFLGISQNSAWFWSLAVYYVFLSLIRFMLAICARSHDFKTDMEDQWKMYRNCGIMLALMSIALAGMVILVMTQGEGFEYEGNMIYAMALYTFYITILAIVNVVRYRRYKSPVISAAKAVNLAAALVSMLALETAMITRFSNDGNAEYFRHTMTAVTGGVVCISVIAVGIYMIASARKKIRKLRVLEEAGDSVKIR